MKEEIGFYKDKKIKGKPIDLGGSDFSKIPHTEETREDLEWVNQNDKGVSIKTGEAFKYIPKEEIAEDDGDIEAKISDQIDGKDKGDEELLPEIENQDDEKIEKLRKELLEKTVNFFQDNEGVAHVGPDFENKNILSGDSLNSSFKKDSCENKEVESDEHFPKFLSKSKFLRKILSYLNNSHLYKKSERNTGEEKDNLKTIAKTKNKDGVFSKLERTHRGKIREILHDSKNYEDPYDREEDEVLDQIFGVAELEDKFKGDHEIEKLQEEEEESINKTISEDWRVGELEKTINKTIKEKEVV